MRRNKEKTFLGMDREKLCQKLTALWEVLGIFLNERSRRIAAAAFLIFFELPLSLMSEATGLDKRTINKGRKEIETGEYKENPNAIRKEGGGRKPKDAVFAILTDCVVNNQSYGDPMKKIQYTTAGCEDTANIVNRLASVLFKQADESLPEEEKRIICENNCLVEQFILLLYPCSLEMTLEFIVQIVCERKDRELSDSKIREIYETLMKPYTNSVKNETADTQVVREEEKEDDCLSPASAPAADESAPEAAEIEERGVSNGTLPEQEGISSEEAAKIPQENSTCSAESSPQPSTKPFSIEHYLNIAYFLHERWYNPSAKGTVSDTWVGDTLSALGYSKQQNQKKLQVGEPFPKRDEQFVYIREQICMYRAMSLPIVSMDGKKKEIIGNFKNPGSIYRRIGDPILVDDHDFGNVRMTPEGLYDVVRNEGYMYLNLSADTSEFAVNCLNDWWFSVGKILYPGATSILILVDCGGSNGYNRRLWHNCLQDFADASGLDIMVCHYPRGCSKWNPIEHRLFPFITHAWSGQPLLNVETANRIINSVTTEKGLKVSSKIDERVYQKGIKVPDEEYNSINIERFDEISDRLNYCIHPGRLSIVSAA